MLVGYARVSTADQHLEAQTDALTAAGAERIFTDSASGALHDRPGLIAALEFVRQGDTLVVARLDRLGRSLPHLLRVIDDLGARGIGLRSLSEALDTSSPGGKFVFQVFASVAEFERGLIRERVRAGIAAAAARGRCGGRPRAMSPDRIDAARKLLRAGSSPREVAAALGVSVPTLYRYLPGAAGLRDAPLAEAA